LAAGSEGSPCGDGTRFPHNLYRTIVHVESMAGERLHVERGPFGPRFLPPCLQATALSPVLW
jgi:hypothetical protein